MSEKNKMLEGKLYMAHDEELSQMANEAKRVMYLYNQTNELDDSSRMELIRFIFKSTEEFFKIQPPIYFDYGKNISIGKNFYANHDCIFLDVNQIIIKDNVMFGPRVSIFTAGHPIDPDVRRTQLEFGTKVVIGNDTWIGGNVVINPGVTIGDRVVIGSGSVVTKDIPSDVIAFGNPCKVKRRITDEDKAYWEKKKAEYDQTK
ncbi:MAG: sugar O-acetyltransferase [Acholeplasmataceae bacterium]|nr:sugar O-acetyltransferase [Acholeplasmataceae bacterium]